MDTPSNNVGDCGTIARLERTVWHDIPARSLPPIDTAPDLRGPSENNTDNNVDLPANEHHTRLVTRSAYTIYQIGPPSGVLCL